MDIILQFISIVALMTLAYICFYLSRGKNNHVFIVVGQDVFKWMISVLLAVLTSRILLAVGIFNQGNSRIANSIVFALAVGGIVWSVRRHGKASK